MSVRIGVNPLTWTNDDMPWVGAEVSLVTCLQQAHTAGYAGIELGNKFPRSAEVLGPILSSHHLELVSGWHSTRLLTRSVDEEIESIKPHIELLKALHAGVVVIAEVTGAIHGRRGVAASRRPRIKTGQWDEFGSKLTKLAAYCKAEGVLPAYHHHMGTVVETQADIDTLMACTGSEVGLLLDTGHCTYAGGNPVELADKYAHRLKHVHCKDVRLDILAESRNRDSSFLASVLRGVFTVPGDGGVDFKAVLSVLGKRNYAGWLVVEAEQDPTVAPAMYYAQKGCTNLLKYCAAAGLKLVA